MNIGLNKSSGDTSLYKTLKDYKEKEFEAEREFQKFFTLRSKMDNKKIRFHVIWNQSNQHDIYDKISKRKISIKSINELNDKILLILNNLFPYKIDNNEINKSGKYAIILYESKFVIIFKFDLDKYKNKEYEIEIKTIMPITYIRDVIKIINLDI